MKVKVRLFGTLSLKLPGYDPEKGLEVEIADGAKVKDLLAGSPQAQRIMISRLVDMKEKQEHAKRLCGITGSLFINPDA